MITARDAAVASLVVLAFTGFIIFYAFGALVSHRPPIELEHIVHDAVYGQKIPIAAKLTRVGFFPTYLGAGIFSLLFGLVFRRFFRDALFAIAALLITWQVSDYFKTYFARERPSGELVFHESSFSYPSGHAALAMAFYGAWAFFIWRSPIPGPFRFLICLALVALIAGVGWSRLALGAHYLADVLGGYLLGFGFAALAVVASRLRSNANL
jgi:membrane-associated phospholipid phosphatase